MNVPARTQEFDPETGEELTGLAVGYGGDNQSLAVSLARAEVDQQIATARALPRRPSIVMQSILSLATLDDKSAEECVYALPRGGKPIKGPSIRLAEIISGQWGNCRVGARVVHVDRIEKYVEAEGVFHDLETNTATTARVRRRISDKSGRIFNDDMIVMTGNAACSIAKRNAILGGVPKAVWRKAYDAVEAVVAGDAATLVERRGKAMKAFAAFGVTPERVCEALGVDDVDDITLDFMPTLMGAHNALKSGEGTVEELFPTKGKEAESVKGKSLDERLDMLAGKPANDKPQGQQTKKDSERSAQAGSDDGKADRTQPAGKTPPEETPSASGGGSDETPEQIARRRGAEARHSGLSRKAIPAEYRKDDLLQTAYLDGFDTGEAEDREPGEEG